MSDEDRETIDRVRARFHRWRWHPLQFVREELKAEPDAWQAEALEAFPHVNRLAFKACKGPGKTAVLAWLILNFLATRPDPRIGATSITEANLDANLWPELAKWMLRSSWLSETFAWSKTQVVHRAHPSTWFCQARTWPKQADAEQQSNAMAGLHADYAMWILDESGGMPQALMTTCEAVLASGVECKVVQSGNPTHNTGPLYRACTTDRALWKIVTITGDPLAPNRSPRISLEWAQQQIDTYGRDNPWVQVNVLGEFPPASINALLGLEDVERAMGRHLPADAYTWSQKRLGVDVARFGDDRSVIFPRQGMASFRPVVMRHERTTAIAARVAKGATQWNLVGDGLIFVDDTGHWGHGVIDQLITAGYPVLPLTYSDRALNKRFKNRRCEFWMQGAEWVKGGGALPNIPDLVAELTEPTYTFIGGQFVLEEKKQVKERLGRSPDLADALFQTFAIPDQPNDVVTRLRGAHQVLHDFDPFAALEDRPAEGHALTDYNPYEPR